MILNINVSPSESHEIIKEKVPKHNEFCEMFLVAERLLNIKFMSYPYI